MGLTYAQKKAIDMPTPLLVSAAAGSGKTTVLAKRAVKLMTGEKPVPADRLLIVTFTNAAAEEMRARIIKLLDEEVALNPSDKALVRQRLMAESANICTIDSFCADFVRENSSLAGVESDFKILDEFEKDILINDAVTKVFNRYYTERNTEFFDLLDAFGADNGDTGLLEAVIDTYDFVCSLPFPELWLNKIYDKCREENSINDYEFAVCAYDSIYKSAIKNINGIKSVMKYFECAGNLAERYAPVFLDIKSRFLNIAEACKEKDWNKLYGELSAYSVKSLPSVKEEDLKPFAETAKFYKEFLKNEISRYAKFVYNNETTLLDDMAASGKFSKTLITLTFETASELKRMMDEKNAYTFSEIEHIALSLLCDGTPDGVVLKDTVEEYVKRYDEVMVDEYQDVNDLQNLLFKILSKDGQKLFCVGDVKQCIYGFRGSNPMNFENMYNTSPNPINMSGNFRSREGICDSVNMLFGRIYDGYEPQKLEFLGEFPENGSTAFEMCFTHGGENAVHGEAECTAKLIKEIIARKPFLKVKNGDGLRKAEYGDIAILLPKLKGRSAEYLRAFKKYGIPAACGGESFTDSPEIMTAISVLQLASNPSRDAEMLSVMMSPIGGFSAEETAKIRLNDKTCSIFASLLASAENGDKKSRAFLDMLSVLRSEALTLPLSEFVYRSMEITGFFELVCTYGEPNTRRANLSVLCDMAAKFEKNSGGGLDAFLQYLKRISEKGMDSPVNVSGNNNVKIMTIHGSKGLQFPICILGGMSDGFVDNSARNRVVLDEHYGIALRFIDENARENKTSLAKHIIESEYKKRLYDEKKRLLYVAVTRAEELAVMTYSDSFSKKMLSELQNSLILFADDEDYYKGIRSDFAGAVLPVFIPKNRFLSDIFGYKGELSEYGGLKAYSLSADDECEAEDETFTATANDEICEKLNEAINYKYPYDKLNTVEAKTSVSALLDSEEKYSAFSLRPAFMSKFGLTPAERGSAMHRFMQVADYESASIDVEKEIERLAEYEYMSREAAESLNRTALKEFFASDIYRRFSLSDFKRHEMKFLCYMSAQSLGVEIDDNILVQGAVDMLFKENGKIVIVDFKTDVKKSEEQLRCDHEKQLKLYAAACESVLGVKVSELYIYSFDLGRAILI